MIRASLIRSIANLARRVVQRYHPVVIGVTGSVGKTSAANAALAVLKAAGIRVAGARRNYNNELGLPLTILGIDAPGRSPSAWTAAHARAVRLLASRDPEYPTHLILEYGADHPGDIAKLLVLVRPTIAVLTAIAPAHLEYFKTIDAIAEEKASLVHAVTDDGVAVLNADDPMVMEVAAGVQVKKVLFGFSASADVRATGVHIAMTGKHEPQGMRWVLTIGTSATEIETLGTLGRAAISSALAGAAVGHALGIDFWTIVRGLSAFEPPLGRTRLLAGRGGSLLVDSSYNSSPAAAKTALDSFAELRMSIPERRRATVVLGSMAELGSGSAGLHHDLGRQVAAINPERLVTIGDEASEIDSGARESGFPPDRIHHFNDSASAGDFLVQNIAAGDLVLIKGSQSARTERVVARLLANPADAPKLLVRQSAYWQSSP